MTKLSVNLNKIALLRNSRGRNFPDPVEFGRLALKQGAHGLTVHPRPDERHAKFSDLLPLRALTTEFGVEFNVEGYPSEDFLKAVIKAKADQCTLVPDPPDALTSNAGWDFVKNQTLLKKVTKQLQAEGIRVSLFLDPYTFNDAQEEALRMVHPERVELYTENYAHAFATSEQEEVLRVYMVAAERLLRAGFALNAGHDLDQKNLGTLIEAVPRLEEVSIGHALMVEALREGFENTIAGYLKILKG